MSGEVRNVARYGTHHPRDAPGGADVGGNTFESHNGTCPSLLGYAGLLGIDDVHDDSALRAR